MKPDHMSARFQLCDDGDAMAELVVNRIVAAAKAAVAERGVFRIVLAGGRSPMLAYRRLAAEHCDWPNWRVYFGDERCVPPGDAQRNSLAIREAWLDRVTFPEGCVHDIHGEAGADAAAASYDRIIRDALPFDLVLLGLGEDGHTASLFPGFPEPEGTRVLAVHNAPKPPPQRVSLSSATLSDAREVLILVNGAAKGEALARWRSGEDLPVARISAGERLGVLIDGEADAAARRHGRNE